MDMEARSYSPDQARQLLQKVKEYKADLAALKQKAQRGAAGAGGGPDARAELGLAGDYYQTSAGQRDRLLTATDRLNKTSDRIQQGRQQLHETEVRRLGSGWELHARVGEWASAAPTRRSAGWPADCASTSKPSLAAAREAAAAQAGRPVCDAPAPCHHCRAGDRRQHPGRPAEAAAAD